MNLLSPTTLKALCVRAGIKPDRRAGQNFLTSQSVLRHIVDAVDPQPQDTILEIGSGFGTLTLSLAPRVARLIAIERDQRIAPILRESVMPYENVEVVERDVLDWLRTLEHGNHRTIEFEQKYRPRPSVVLQSYSSMVLKSYSPTVLRPPWKLAANLPYSITGDFLRLLFDAIGEGALPPPKRAVLMLQREVVDRMLGRRGVVGFLTVLVQLHAEPHLIARVPRGAFWPVPKVESSVVLLDHWRSPAEIALFLGGVGRDRFLAIVRTAYARRRRQVAVGLRAFIGGKETARAAFSVAGVDPTARPESLNLNEWVAIARAVDRAEV
ncbi:MAG: 16S rRNA (adenine(1518)-N(6)/adenine(1519)-N(6))-dimethyltransferase RsmA, partial [Candidatus Uhrbacteria bacterium]